MRRIFQMPERLRPGLNPRTRVPEASMLTTRPPKPSLLSLCSSLNVSDQVSHPYNITGRIIVMTRDIFNLALLWIEKTRVWTRVALLWNVAWMLKQSNRRWKADRLRGRTHHCCASATVHKQFKYTCVYTLLPVMGSEYKFYTTKKTAIRNLPLLTTINGNCG